MAPHSFSIHVPASSGNVGPGFDVLGLALSFHNTLQVDVINRRPGSPTIFIEGEGEGRVPASASNVIYKTMQAFAKRYQKTLPQVRLHCVNRIPLARGLGSSSAAYLSGLLAANFLLGRPASPLDLLSFATELEGHPDNVAPALLGGVRASGVWNGQVSTVLWPSPTLRMVVAVPSFELSTKKARAVLPAKVPMKDAVSNLSSVALMAHAFSKDLSLLSSLLNDRLHEPYRARLVPGFYAVKKAALQAGAYGMTLSGAGPTVLAFAPPSKASAIANAMQRAFSNAGVQSRALNLTIDQRGAFIQ